MLRRITKGCKSLQALVVLTLAFSFGLVSNAIAITDHSASDHKAKKAHDRPAWLEKLETQIDYEEMMRRYGRPTGSSRQNFYAVDG